MSKKKSKPKAKLGKKVGTKRADMRWQSPDGDIWDSQFEYKVYKAGIHAGIRLRRCVKGREADTISYRHSIRGASCQDCGSDRVGSARQFTPDLFVYTGLPDRPEDGFYLEIKGYLRAPKRALLRSLFKEKQDLDLRFILQSDFKVSKSLRFSGWITKFLPGSRWVVFNGTWPTTWNLAHERKKIKTNKETNQ